MPKKTLMSSAVAFCLGGVLGYLVLLLFGIHSGKQVFTACIFLLSFAWLQGDNWTYQPKPLR